MKNAKIRKWLFLFVVLSLSMLIIGCVAEQLSQEEQEQINTENAWESYENPLVQKILENNWVVTGPDNDQPPEGAESVTFKGVVVYSYDYYAFVVGEYEGKENVGIRIYRPKAYSSFKLTDKIKNGDVVQVTGKLFGIEYTSGTDFNICVDSLDDIQVLDETPSLPEPLEIPKDTELDSDHYGALVEATLTYEGTDDYDHYVFKNGETNILVVRYSDMPSDLEEGREYYLLGVVGQFYGYKLFIQEIPLESQGEYKPITIDEVTDGDTFKIGDTSCRIVGIDTPEIHESDKPIGEYGQEAKGYLESFSSSYTLSIQEFGEDVYGRKLVSLYGYDSTRDAIYLYAASVTAEGYARPLFYDNVPDDVKEKVTSAYNYAYENEKGIFSKWNTPPIDWSSVNETYKGTILWLSFTPNATGIDEFGNYYVAYEENNATKAIASIRPDNFYYLGIDVNDDYDNSINEDDMEAMVCLMKDQPIKVYGELWWKEYPEILTRAYYEFEYNGTPYASSIADVINTLTNNENAYKAVNADAPPCDVPVVKIKGVVTYMYTNYAYVVDENNNGLKLFFAEGDLKKLIQTGDTVEVTGRPYIKEYTDGKENRVYIGVFYPDEKYITKVTDGTIDLSTLINNPFILPAGSDLSYDLFGKIVKLENVKYTGTDYYGNYEFDNGGTTVYVSKYSEMPNLTENSYYNIIGVVGQHYGYKLFVWDSNLVEEVQQ